MKIRFKTYREFKNEFGPNWENIVDWTVDMNYLFGYSLTDIEVREFMFYSRNDDCDNTGQITSVPCMGFSRQFEIKWWVSTNMLIINNEEV